MKEESCPYCGGDVEPVRFGEGWVGICCGRILYNSRRAPEEGPDPSGDTPANADTQGAAPE